MKCNVFGIWDKYKDSLRWYILKRVRRNEDAEDILQTVLMKITRYCKNKSDVSNIRSWLYQIAWHCIADYYKHQSRFKPLSTDLIDSTQTNIQRNAVKWILPLLSTLPEKYSEPLKLADLDGFNQKEVAKKLEISLPAAKSRIQRGRNKLKEKFNECGIVETDGDRFIFTVTKPCCETW